MKYWFLIIEIINGEYTFFSKSVHSSNNKFNADGYVKNFYANVDGKKDKNGWHTFNAGDVACRVYYFVEIKKEEYDVLSKFI